MTRSDQSEIGRSSGRSISSSKAVSNQSFDQSEIGRSIGRSSGRSISSSKAGSNQSFDQSEIGRSIGRSNSN